MLKGYPMNLKILFSRHTRHLWLMATVIIAGGAGAVFVRSQLVPPDFGRLGPYRAGALAEEASHQSVFQADAVCLKCHTDVEEQRAESPHQAVACVHCHGRAVEHVAAAAIAAENPGHPIPPASEWDGDFRTHTDLFVTQHRKTCLACHTRVVGMPDSFRTIVVAEHLEEQGASEPESDTACFECHDGHAPGL
ncbi:MAG: hypothetical protein KDA89_06115 [Planctomycetaceae bacterium]|nr:hypothetical protein [Planctomycetaceae bacterium]